MIYQNAHGDQSATTRSAVAAGTITVTDQAAQAQDVSGLSRDTSNTNGTVSSTPDVNAILNQQADLMQAAQAAGQVVAQGIGAYADMKRDDALDAAQAAFDRGDLDVASAALADYNNWKEGGNSRALMQAAGGRRQAAGGRRQAAAWLADSAVVRWARWAAQSAQDCRQSWRTRRNFWREGNCSRTTPNGKYMSAESK